ncbi:MAG: tRNA epoxyqueuosine(34) reductase QueG [Cyanothece sp. SIO1E1]|nr:tRNA epoxyqueuosine(34) reductase QueG [Cyanothece sp. SIO1E1]
MSASISSHQIKQKALELGFHQVGIAAVDNVEDIVEHAEKAETGNLASKVSHSSIAAPNFLRQWLAQGYHAGMAWMKNAKRQDIRQVMPTVQSVICVALNYYTAHERPPGKAYAKISRYGWGRDYHRVMHKKLKALSIWLQSQSPPQGQAIQAHYYADTGPIQDKVWAQRAGIGWIAKNSNLITRDYGSWVFLGEILTNLELEPDQPHTEHCGTCTRCLEACPTQAIPQPYVVDANRCLAYHTIENRTQTLPATIVPHLQGWVAGCDICQDVCPWNQRFAQETDVDDFQPYPWNVAPTLFELAKISQQEYNRRFPASALRRIKPEMMRRNAKANLENVEG